MEKKQLKPKYFNSRKIAFISILIATSVSFVLVMSKIMPLAIFPSFKISIGGLPVKLTGYIFGPLVGGLTGLLADLLSFAIMPSIIHPYYMLAFSMAGFIPGLFSVLYFRKWRKNDKFEKELEVKVNNKNFICTLILLLTIIGGIFVFLIVLPPSAFVFENALITNKWIFMAIACFGLLTMVLTLIVTRFILKPKTFNALVPIIAFTAVLELVNTNLKVLGDMSTIVNKTNYLDIMLGHLLISPVKFWINMPVILIAYNIISPLIYNKVNNGWEK